VRKIERLMAQRAAVEENFTNSGCPSWSDERLEEHDEQIQNIFEAIRQLMTPPDPSLSPFPLSWREREGEGVVFH